MIYKSHSDKLKLCKIQLNANHKHLIEKQALVTYPLPYDSRQSNRYQCFFCHWSQLTKFWQGLRLGGQCFWQGGQTLWQGLRFSKLAGPMKSVDGEEGERGWCMTKCYGMVILSIYWQGQGYTGNLLAGLSKKWLARLAGSSSRWPARLAGHVSRKKNPGPEQ